MSEVAPPKREPASWRIWLFRILVISTWIVVLAVRLIQEQAIAGLTRSVTSLEEASYK